MQLRPYQEEAANAVFREWEHNRSTLLVMGTGLGKTVVFSEITKRLVEEGKRVLIIAHQGQLLQQAQTKLYNHAQIPSKIEKAKDFASMNDQVVIGSIQTLAQDNRLHRFSSDHFDTIIIDECHHAMAKSYQKVIDYFENAKLLGVTATPNRGDSQSIMSTFQSTAFQFGIKEGVEAGYLSPLCIRTCPLPIDVSQVAIQAGDYQAGALGNVLEPYMDAIADQIIEKAQGRKILVFVPLVKTGERFAEILREKGLRTASISGKTKNQAEIIEKFHNGELDVVTNAMLLTEGFDDPAVNCIVNLRATKSQSLYTQIMGRGLRLSPDTGKEDCLILDFLWQSKKRGYDVLSPIDILMPDKDIPYAKEIVKTSKDELSLNDLMGLASKARLNAEEALAKKLLYAQTRRCMGIKFNEIDDERVVYQYDTHDELDCITINSEAFSYLQPMFGKNLNVFYPRTPRDCMPVSNAQKEVLRNNGFEDLVQFNGHANRIIEAIMLRKKRGFCTYQQSQFLAKRKFLNTKYWSAEDAKDMLDQIVKNNWVTPYWIHPKKYIPDSVKKLLIAKAKSDYMTVGNNPSKQTNAMKVCDANGFIYKPQKNHLDKETEYLQK